MASTILMTNTPAQAQTNLVQPILAPPSGVTANATVPSKAYLSFRPNLVGIGQPVLVNLWTTPAPGAGRYFLDYKVTITKPDATKEEYKMNSYVADGTAWFEYVPDQTGTYKLKFEFPGTYFPTGNYSLTSGAYMATTSYQAYTTSAYYQPASTAEQTLTVQEGLVYSWPASPLPTDYWTRPVAFENREWWSILGDYPWVGPGGGAMWNQLYPNTNPYWNGGQYFVPWVQGPTSPHVVWKRQGDIGGLAGAGYKQENYIWPNTGFGNEPSIIFQGRCYQTVTKVKPVTVNGSTSNIAVNTWQCYDLRTGEIYWEQTGVPAPNNIEYAYGSMPVPGVTPKLNSPPNLVYIGGGRLIKYHTFTGAIVLNVSIAPLSSSTYYMNGYALGVQNLGNSIPATQRYRLINWTTYGSDANFTTRVLSNISYAISNVPTTTDYGVGIAATISGITVGGAYVGQNVTAVSLITGKVLWSVTNDEPVYSGSSNVADHGKVAMLSARGFYLGYDLNTGKLVWQTDTMDYPWDEPGWGTYGSTSAYGLFYREAYSGVYAFSWETGKIMWKYEAPAVTPFESDFTDSNGSSVYPFNAPALVADGKMYIYNAEHSPDSPQHRGWATHCINATTGEFIWKVMIAGGGWFGGSSAELAVADGYLSLGGSDGIQYIFGRGKTATTVTASPKTVSNGAQILIEGTVLDQSPAQAGTPCVSKDSMATQMEYLHKQMPIGGVWGNTTITGVPVTLTALDSNGNIVDIGKVTTNGYYGTFSLAWTPPQEGTYEIMASFAADDSYGSSQAATSIAVSAAPAASTTPTQTPLTMPPFEIYTIGAAIAVIIAVAIVGLLILRKHP